MCAILISFGLLASGPRSIPNLLPDHPMTPTITTKDHDKAVLETLKEVHNRGAELYNDGDHTGAFRLYQGGLIVARSLLAHRSRQLDLIREGLEQIEKSQADPKLKAFRLHEVIEQIRTDLKAEMKKQVEFEKPAEAAVTGHVAVAGQRVEGIAIGFVPAGTNKALAVARTQSGGQFHVPSTLPIGAYFVTLSGEGIPERHAKPDTTPLKVDLKVGVNTLPFDVK